MRSVKIAPVPGPDRYPEDPDELTEEEIEELGGVEYRALQALSWIVGLVSARRLLAPTQFLGRLG